MCLKSKVIVNYKYIICQQKQNSVLPGPSYRVDFPCVEAFSHTNNPFIQMGYTTCINFPCLLYCENIYHQKKPIHNEDLLVQICKEITYFFVVKYYFLQDLSYVFVGICAFVHIYTPPLKLQMPSLLSSLLFNVPV